MNLRKSNSSNGRVTSFKTYAEAESFFVHEICHNPDYVNHDTSEMVGVGFTLTNPLANKNKHSNYEYAQAFFDWLISGKGELSSEVLRLNPWAQRFIDTSGLPEGFSGSYGIKLAGQLDVAVNELKVQKEGRRSYVSILWPSDQIILTSKTTHEYPCTVGFSFFVRNGALDMVVNMRSNNCLNVLPYDVYNFTSLQKMVAFRLGVDIGYYTHFANSLHVFKSDVRSVLEGGYEWQHETTKLLSNEFEPIRKWADKVGILAQCTSHAQIVKLGEESGELCRHVLRNNKQGYTDALGDILIVMVNLAASLGISLEQALNLAWQEVHSREGKIKNGTFIKQGDNS